MPIIYNIGIFFLGLGLRIASLFNSKAKKWIAGRKNYFESLPVIDKKKDVYWFHCASLGEFDQGLPLMNLVKEKDPSIYLLVTFFSPSGMDFHQKRKHQADHVCYLPLDTPGNAAKFIAHFNPKSAFFIKYEFWSNHIFKAKNNGTKLYNVSGIFREDHRFFKSYGGYFRKTLRQFDWFFVQNDDSKKLLNSIQLNNVTVTGDIRYDRVLENKSQSTDDPILENFCSNSKTLIIGSSWPEDERIVLPYVQTHNEKVIIAPHNIDPKHIEGITSSISKTYQLYTDYDKTKKSDILILNTIGHLSNAYKYGTYAYVGGGFSGSLHNILEPAVFGLPVVFGPKHKRFPEAQQFIDAGFGFSVQSAEEMKDCMVKITDNLSAITKEEMTFVETNAGSARKIYAHLSSN